jgi:hypothetical protein
MQQRLRVYTHVPDELAIGNPPVFTSFRSLLSQARYIFNSVKTANMLHWSGRHYLQTYIIYRGYDNKTVSRLMRGLIYLLCSSMSSLSLTVCMSLSVPSSS